MCLSDSRALVPAPSSRPQWDVLKFPGQAALLQWIWKASPRGRAGSPAAWPVLSGGAGSQHLAGPLDPRQNSSGTPEQPTVPRAPCQDLGQPHNSEASLPRTPHLLTLPTPGPGTNGPQAVWGAGVGSSCVPPPCPCSCLGEPESGSAPAAVRAQSQQQEQAGEESAGAFLGLWLPAHLGGVRLHLQPAFLQQDPGRCLWVPAAPQDLWWQGHAPTLLPGTALLQDAPHLPEQGGRLL